MCTQTNVGLLCCVGSGCTVDGAAIGIGTVVGYFRLFSPRLNYDIKNNYFLTKSKTFPKANSLISEGLLQWQRAVLLCATSHTKTFTAIEG